MAGSTWLETVIALQVLPFPLAVPLVLEPEAAVVDPRRPIPQPSTPPIRSPTMTATSAISHGLRRRGAGAAGGGATGGVDDSGAGPLSAMSTPVRST
jgi:hypothetical protein